MVVTCRSAPGGAYLFHIIEYVEIISLLFINGQNGGKKDIVMRKEVWNLWIFMKQVWNRFWIHEKFRSRFTTTDIRPKHLDREPNPCILWLKRLRSPGQTHHKLKWYKPFILVSAKGLGPWGDNSDVLDSSNSQMQGAAGFKAS